MKKNQSTAFDEITDQIAELMRGESLELLFVANSLGEIVLTAGNKGATSDQKRMLAIRANNIVRELAGFISEIHDEEFDFGEIFMNAKSLVILHKETLHMVVLRKMKSRRAMKKSLHDALKQVMDVLVEELT